MADLSSLRREQFVPKCRFKRFERGEESEKNQRKTKHEEK